ASSSGSIGCNQAARRVAAFQGTRPARPDPAGAGRADIGREAAVSGDHPRCRNQYALAGVRVFSADLGSKRHASGEREELLICGVPNHWLRIWRVQSIESTEDYAG